MLMCVDIRIMCKNAWVGVYVSMYMCIYIPVCMDVLNPCMYYVQLYMCALQMVVCRCIYVVLCLYVIYLFIYLSIYLLIYLFIYMCVCVCFTAYKT